MDRKLKEYMDMAKDRKITISLDDYLEAVTEVMNDMGEKDMPPAVVLKTDEIVAEAVRDLWTKEGPQELIAFFWQKYEWEEDDEWEWCEELVECCSDTDYEQVLFLNDFNEGQNCIKELKLVPLSEVTETYSKLKGWGWSNGPEFED